MSGCHDLPLRRRAAPLTGAHQWAWLPGRYGLVVLMPWLLPDRPMRWDARTAIAAGVVYLACAQVAALRPRPRGRPR
ncbi:hypothetical protein [Micromonospora sp. NPDC002575]|uniref:hypothetical protein n=1 Tax=Micromonospora sp. NPDC002575 TaxID=3364222 RepID=UPI003691DA52